MACREAEDQLIPYLLGALDSKGMSRMDRHVGSCPECSSVLRQEGDIAAELAYAVPQLEAPVGVKQRLFSRIETGEASDWSAVVPRAWPGFLSNLGRRLVANAGMAVAAMLAAVIVVGGVWFDGRLDRVAEEKEALASQLGEMTKTEAEMAQRLRAERQLTYKATAPGASVKVLSSTKSSANASALIVVAPTGMGAVLSSIDLPQLGEGQVYQVWLVKDNWVYSTGVVFTVDSTGYGEAELKLSVRLGEFDAILITTESGGGNPAPTGESVLSGDL